jgi:hypothetical protein
MHCLNAREHSNHEQNSGMVMTKGGQDQLEAK